MKILIIATPRSSSTSLAKQLGELINGKVVYEPYNRYHPNYRTHNFESKTLPDRIVMKTLIDHIPIGAKQEDSSTFPFYLEEMKKYDRVILLSRKDIKSAYESFSYHQALDQPGSWHQPYVYEEIDFDVRAYNTFLKWNHFLIEFSLETGIDITWYEDLYSGNPEKFKEVVDPWDLGVSSTSIYTKLTERKKYRIINRKNTLI